MGEPPMPRTHAKLAEEKLRFREEKSEVGRRRVKMRDLKSVLRSEVMWKGNHFSTRLRTHRFIPPRNVSVPTPPRIPHPSKLLNHKVASDSLHCDEEVDSAVTAVRLEGSQLKVNDERDGLVMDKKHGLLEFDLNYDIFSSSSLAGEEGLKHADEPKEMDVSTSLTQDKASKDGVPVRSGGFRFDLNVKDIPTSTHHNPFYPYKNLNRLKSQTVSECGSSTGPVEEKDPLRIWNVMKQNGFLSSSHGAIPVPKKNGRKSKNNALKKKLELAKKEEVDRFAKIAAPSGLLNELNPGIINHVRNRRQVHAIIEALVRSESSANGNVERKQPNTWKGKQTETNSWKESSPNETGNLHFYYDNLHPSVSGRKDNVDCPMSVDKSLSVSEEKCKDSYPAHLRGLLNKRFRLNPNTICQDDDLALRLSSATNKASDIAYSAPDEDSTSFGSFDTLSMKAASIASHWLELMHQDIKARLTALRRSKRRVQAVISTELPCLLSKEFSSNPASHPYFAEEAFKISDNSSNADIHGLKWKALFKQVEEELAEEEQKLEIWLCQVREMQRHCDHGLQVVHYSVAQSMENQFAVEFISRPGSAENSERELAMRAAAASIYSTCNFLLEDKNVSCC